MPSKRKMISDELEAYFNDNPPKGVPDAVRKIHEKFNIKITATPVRKWLILPSAATSSYLSAKISPCCVANPQWATAHLAVCFLSDKILS